ncbi:MAG: hypothetical protein LAN36_10005 [Acidobacteriia bacterium]|nr:hypothetical protein [Terriglobia bacterium]
MNERIVVRPLSLVFMLAMFLFAPASRAQDNSDEVKGIDSGNYNIQQSVELGYRGTWINGGQDPTKPGYLDTYNTFVNLHEGPRLLDYTLNMRSINHQGLFFDRLNFSNFGYGGDPDDVSRLGMEKNKWYDFSVVFRRHKNFWDYNLLANPLNPVPFSTATTPPSTFTTTNPAFAVRQSPHSLDRVRRMGDYDLALFPQSRVRVRLGYSRLVDEGPSFTSFHGTTDFLLAQNFRMTTNAYRMGVDFQILPKTTFSYDQFLEWNKNDTNESLANTPFLVQTSQFPGTVPVDMGLNWYYPPTATTTPCAAPFLATGFASPTCKEYLSYSRTAPQRNFQPTERLSFQSTFIPKLEMSGSASYSTSHNVVSNLNDFANEWTNSTTSLIRNAIVTGPANSKQIFAHANWSAIYSLTQKLRIVDSIRYDSWQNPGFTNLVSTNLFATGVQAAGQAGILLPVASFAPLVPAGPGVGTSFASICPSPFNAVTCPQHQSTSSSGASADVSSTIYSTFMGQRVLSNTIQLQADFTNRISGRIGYMYENRHIGEIDGSADTAIPVFSVYYPGGTGGSAANDFLAARGNCPYSSGTTTFNPANGGTCTQNSDGSVTYTAPLPEAESRVVSTIDEHVGLLGLTVRPMDTLRIYADFEFGYNSYSYTRIWPRQIQSYKVHANYRPRPWATIDGAIDIHENRDNVPEVNNLEHGRTYSFSTVLAPNSKFAYTLGYNYTDLYLQTYICFRETFGSLAGPGIPVYPACTISNSPSGINLGATEFYINKQHYAYSDVMWKPMKRVTTTLGYAGTFAGGTERGGTLFLNPLAPGGTLAFNYHKPFASIQIDVYKGLSWKTAWNYYGYNSKTPINTSVPITNPNSGGVYQLEPIPGPDFNGSTATFSVRYAF